MEKYQRLNELINRKPESWLNITRSEFEKDIVLLQKNCKHLVIRESYVKQLNKTINEQAKVLAFVRENLLPFVDENNNPCGDMVVCTVSNVECLTCLSKHIRQQLEKLWEL